MGIKILHFSGSSFEPSPKQLNPDPDNYTILKHRVLNNYLIIEIQYHDCINYEGRKILVFACSLEQLLKQKKIDPHFCDNLEFFSPIARFEPTEQGWLNALKFLSIL